MRGGVVDLNTDAANDLLVLTFSVITITSLMFYTIPMFVLKNCFDFNYSRMITQLVDCKTSADIPQVSVSAELLLQATRFQTSAVVPSYISRTRFAANSVYLPVEISHCLTVLVSVSTKTLLTNTLKAPSRAYKQTQKFSWRVVQRIVFSFLLL